MLYYFVLQIGSYNTTADITNLCLLPDEKLLPDTYRMNMTVWRRGKACRKSVRSLPKRNLYLRELSEKPFNDLTMTIGLEPYRLADHDITVVGIRAFMKLSPLNILWGQVCGYLLEDRGEEQRRSQSESSEIGMRYFTRKKYPTTYATIISFESSLPRKELVRIWAQVLRNCLSPEMTAMGIFGGGDVFENLPTDDLLGDLAPYQLACEKLEEQFDRHHDILIHSGDICARLAQESGEEANYYDLSSNGGFGGLATLHPYVAIKCKEFFIQRDETNQVKDPGPESGEYMIRTNRYITRKRYYELFDRKLLRSSELFPNPVNPEMGWIHFPLVLDNFWVALGISPDDVLLIFRQRISAIQFKESVYSWYAKFNEVQDQKQRIWLAHEKAFVEVLWAPQELIDFVKERHFPGI